MDFAGTDEFFGYASVRLSKTSLKQLEDHMQQLARQARILHRVDQGVLSEDKQWYTLLVAQRETNWGFPVDNGKSLVPRRAQGPTYPSIAEPPTVND